MEGRLQHGSRAQGATGSGARTKGLVFGLVSGLAATIVIDLITMGVLPFMGLLSLMTVASTLVGRRTAMIDKLAFGDTIKDIATGYRMCTSPH
jgi:hypothetical protein